jgi:hypothetical protein
MNKPGTGAVQKRTRRRFIESNAQPVPFSELTLACYPEVTKPLRWHRKSVYRALAYSGAPTGQRGWWRPAPWLAALIRGDDGHDADTDDIEPQEKPQNLGSLAAS